MLVGERALSLGSSINVVTGFEMPKAIVAKLTGSETTGLTGSVTTELTGTGVINWTEKKLPVENVGNGPESESASAASAVLPEVPVDHKTVRKHLFIIKNIVVVSLFLSGDSFHYRQTGPKGTSF